MSDSGPELVRGHGVAKILFVDAVSGVSGDMLVAALLDLGIPAVVADDAIAALGLEAVRAEHGHVMRAGIRARRFTVHADGPQQERSHADIVRLLEESTLPDGARTIALDAFALLARAEAQVHGVEVAQVHFHEVGAVDSIVDVTVASACLDHLGARVVASPLPLGRGMTHSRHGMIPVPAPATVLCLLGVPTFDGGVEQELVTPTGACLVATATSEFARWPSMRPERVGWGAGSRELVDRPNVLRLVLGEPGEHSGERPERDHTHVIIETNLDDTSPEIAAHAVERLLAAGALDAWTSPIGMKKGRSATMIAALGRDGEAEALARVLMSETSTLGVRIRPCRRMERPRRVVEVQTRFGPIPVKIADGDGLPANVAPEFEACRRAALTRGVPIKDVYAAAVHAVTRAVD